MYYVTFEDSKRMLANMFSKIEKNLNLTSVIHPIDRAGDTFTTIAFALEAERNELIEKLSTMKVVDKGFWGLD